MSYIVSPELPHNVLQPEPDLGRDVVLNKVHGMNAPQVFHIWHPQESSNDAITTRLIHDQKPRSDDSETDDEKPSADSAPSLLNNAQRKRAQHAVFEDFVREQDDSQLRQRLHEAEMSAESVDEFASNDTTSTRKIIDRVRDYQSELFARAKAGNIIAVLDTGSGKTLIAALLLRDVVTKEMDDRASGHPPRTSFFLTNSVALAEQQHQMLQENLATMPALVHGRTFDAWGQQEWNDLFSAHQVIVCTAAILDRCLTRAHIKMENINLIIFDEAHHAKKEHPYATIIRDHYPDKRSSSTRPKIFGMTASPVDGKNDVLQAAQYALLRPGWAATLTIRSMLETLLDAKIVTTKSLSLDTYAPRAAVQEWEYDKLADPFETALYQQLKFCNDMSAFSIQFKDARDATATLGAWCSDQIWRYALEEHQFHKTLRKYEMLEPPVNGVAGSDKTTGIEKLKQAEKLVRLHHFQEPVATREFLSSKVLLLYYKLCQYFGGDEKTRCLIFVDQRITAQVLYDLFCHLNVPNLRPDTFLGGGTRSGQAGITGPQVRDLKARFQSGLVNCLFCTSVAEEGIDSPECNLVIRFDLYNTMIQYVQSRGRARAKGSIYGQMVERENVLHKVKIEDAHHHETQLRHFLSDMEDDRFLESEFLGIQGAFGKVKPNKTFGTTAGTQCNYRTSIFYLDRYASSLQYERPGLARVTYEPEIAEGMFRFRTILPDGSPVKGAVGESFPNKTAAKQSAAWETCFALRARGLLDEHLNSVFFKQRPKNANARLAVSSAKRDEYDMLVKPQFWTVKRDQLPNTLFLTLIHLVPSAGLTRPHDPLILLTRSALPPIPEFPVYLDGNIETKVVFAHQRSSYPVDHTMLLCLTQFTLQVFRDLFNKDYEAEGTQMPYWLAPTKWHPSHTTPQSLRELVDPIALTDSKPIQWSPDSDPKGWCDQFLIDKWSGKYRYWSRGLRSDLNIDSSVPVDVPIRRFKGAKAEKVMEYTLSLFGQAKSRFLEGCDQSQPVLQAELIQIRRNFLDKADAKDFEEYKHEYHICPEPLALSKLPHGFITTALVFPAIMSRLDSYLIATEACQKLDLDIPSQLALEAITKDANNTEEHREQQIHIQRGMGKNYERLEFLGDSFLKMTTTIMVFVRYPKSDELGFHVKRMEMICNLNLFNVAVDPSVGLTQSVRTKGFNRRYWYPEGIILRGGKGAIQADMKPVKHETPKHALSQKTIADVSEALIGAALLSSTLPNDYNMAIRAVTKLVNSKDHDIQSWQDYSRLYEAPSWSTDTSPDGFTYGIDSPAAKIQKRLGYTFRYPRLLRSAMTHPSYTDSIVPDYQRLEFLGDSILDMVCIRNLYDRFPDRDPHWLTEHKMAMVSNKFLGAVAVDLGFDQYLYSSGLHIPQQIRSYALKIRDRLPAAKRDNHIDFWIEIEDPPKCLSDTVESYIGAVFVDSNFDYREVEKFFEKHIYWYFSDMAVYDTFANKHPTTELHSILTKQYKCQQYRLHVHNAQESGLAAAAAKTTPKIRVGVMIHNEVAGYGEGTSSRYAKVRASKLALQSLRGMSRDKFRREFKCWCRDDDYAALEAVPIGGGEEACAL